MFLTHLGKANQIDRIDATHSLLIIFVIIAIFMFLMVRKMKKIDETDFLQINTSTALRGVAIICLIFGHFAVKCVDGKYFFESAGEWAVIIFLYISGVALSKSYGIEKLENSFFLRRAERLVFPTWATLGFFFVFGYLLLGETFTIKQIILNFMLIIGSGLPNGPAWFVTYIIYLYLLFFMVSKLNFNAIYKIACLFLLSYVVTFILWHNYFNFSYFINWPQYTFVFPASVCIGLYRREISAFLSKIIKFPALYLILALVFFCQYFFDIGIYRASILIDSWTYSEIIKTIQPLSLLLLLTMVSFLLDRSRFYSKMLDWLGRYAFEIFLVHMPLMVYYDFFLFRKPLYFFFFLYICVVLFLSAMLHRFSNKFNQFLF